MSRLCTALVYLACTGYAVVAVPVCSQGISSDEDFLRLLGSETFVQVLDESAGKPGCGLGPGGPRRGQYDQPQFGKHVEQFRMLKLLELLDLQEEQEVPFITLFHRMRTQQRELQLKRVAVTELLSHGLRSGKFSEREITLAARQLLQERRNELDLRENFLKEAGEILTPLQLGRLILFQERFELELLGAVRTFRERVAERRRQGQSAAPDSIEGENK